MRLIAGIALPAAILALTPTAAGAVEVKGSKLAASLKDRISAQSGVEVTSSRCPRTIEVHKGAKVTCKLRFASGDRTPINVRFTNSRGDFDFKVRDFLVRHLEDQIEGAFADRGTPITVTCPAKRRIQKGDQFTCDASDANGNQAIFDITQTGKGLATYKLRG